MHLQGDMHTHTIASTHAYSTITENCQWAAKYGMKGILLRCMPCRNGGRQCCLPDIDRQTPAGLPCPEPESLVADGGELHRHASGQFTRPAQCRTATFFLHPIHIVCHMFFLFRPYFFHSKICDRRERICPPSNRRARGARVFGNPET